MLHAATADQTVVAHVGDPATNVLAPHCEADQRQRLLQHSFRFVLLVLVDYR